MAKKPVLSIRNLTMRYARQHPAVEDVSLDVYEGEILCLLGANGSGKSTLIKGVLGLMPPESGTVDIRCGRDRLAYLPQMNTAERDFPATAREIVLSGTQKSGHRLPFYTKADRKNAQEAMEALKIDAFASRRIGSLSGGQQQRVLLARAVARKPDLLLLDEPCSALDPTITRELYALFAQLRERYGVAILLSTHDWDYAAERADRVAMMDCQLKYVKTREEFQSEKEDAAQ